MMINYSSVWFMLLLSCSSCRPCRGGALDDEQQEQRQRQRQRQQQEEDEDDYIPPYDYYPDYCSTKVQVEATRNIPPLRDDDVPVGETRLIHVAVITRHGARTPLIEDQYGVDGGGFCWKGYMDREADTSVWDCTLTTWMGTPPVQAIQEEQGITPVVPFDDSLLWIDKRYDAFTASSSSSESSNNNNNLSNSLNGTCQMGQLLTGGYHQQKELGKFLRKAYLYPPDTTQDGYRHHDERMRLTSEMFQNSKLSFRVDDVQRTILSGQALLQGLFGTPLIQGNLQETVIPMTMVDYSRDVFGLYQDACPRLQELNQQAVTSPEFLALQQSSEARLWTKFMQTYFGRIPRSTIDCLMTTICSDKTLPPAIDDFVTPTGRRRRRQRRMETSNMTDNTMATNNTSTPTRAPTTSTLPLAATAATAAPTSSPIISSSSSSPPSSEWDDDYGRDRFRRLVDFSTKNASFPFTWQDAVISKLAMVPLWTHLLHNIKAATKSETIDDTSYPKLALVSSHDSTIWALLASLGMNSLLDHVPPYASMLLLEIHEIIGGSRNTSMFASNFALRMVYNGKVVTPLLPGCSTNSDLCDLQVLTKLVEPFATTRQRNCNATQTAATTTTMAGSGGGSSSSSSNNGADAPAVPALNTVSGLSNQDIQETRDAFRSPVGIFGLTLLANVSFGFGSLITFCILSKQRRCDTF